MDLLALEFGNDELDATVGPVVEGRSSGAYSGFTGTKLVRPLRPRL
jgi:hypothetical protein